MAVVDMFRTGLLLPSADEDEPLTVDENDADTGSIREILDAELRVFG